MASTELLKTILKNSANLKAYYRFESGALTTDDSGNSHTLTNNNTATDTTGKFGGGVNLVAASSQYLTVANHADYNFGTGDYAMGCWFKKASNGWTGGLIGKLKSDDTVGHALYFAAADNKISYYVPASAVSLSTAAITDTNWHLVVVTRISGVFYLYLDSSLSGSQAVTKDLDSTVQFHVGSLRDASANFFNGDIDDTFVIKGSGVSADQIKELYEGRNLGELRPQTGLVGLWHLNGNSTDSSGNGINGTDTNITYSTGKFAQGATATSTNAPSIVLVNAAFNVTSGDATWSFWNKSSSYTSQIPFFSGGGFTVSGYYSQIDNGGIIYFYSNQSGAFQEIKSSSGALSTSSIWQYVVITKSGTTITIYVNSVVVATGSITNPTAGGNNLYLLQYGQGTPSYRGPAITDEFSFWNVAKSASWVRQQYSLGRFGEL